VQLIKDLTKEERKANKTIIHVVVVEARGIKARQNDPTAYCVTTLHNLVHVTKQASFSSFPIWREYFTFEINDEKEKVSLRICSLHKEYDCR